MLTYPFAAHWLFAGDSFRAGLFMGTSVHETSQVAGAGLVYQEYFGDAAALDAATVTKLVRNLGMLVVIPLLSILYHRKSGEGETRPSLWSMVPLFVIGFALMSLLRTVGDMSETAFRCWAATWKAVVSTPRMLPRFAWVSRWPRWAWAQFFQSEGDRQKPLGVGLFSAVLVGGVSYTFITLLY
jgi:uncharacterized membrane protein YadS